MLTDLNFFSNLQGIVHGDMKPSNVLLDSKGRARVSDFGLARSISTTARTTHVGGGVGTPGFMPPELLKNGGKSTAEGDVFALSMVFFEVLSGTSVFANLEGNAWAINLAVICGDRPPLSNVLSPTLSQLMLTMWNPEPKGRPKMLGVAQVLLEAETGGGEGAPRQNVKHMVRIYNSSSSRWAYKD